MNKQWFAGACCALGLGLIAGCATEYDPALRESPNFSMGYGNGCQTANSRVAGFKDTVTRNENLFKDDRAYQAGWREGYASCGGRVSQTIRETEVFGGEDLWHQQGPL